MGPSVPIGSVVPMVPMGSVPIGPIGKVPKVAAALSTWRFQRPARGRARWPVPARSLPRRQRQPPHAARRRRGSAPAPAWAWWPNCAPQATDEAGDLRFGGHRRIGLRDGRQHRRHHQPRRRGGAQHQLARAVDVGLHLDEAVVHQVVGAVGACTQVGRETIDRPAGTAGSVRAPTACPTPGSPPAWPVPANGRCPTKAVGLRICEGQHQRPAGGWCRCPLHRASVTTIHGRSPTIVALPVTAVLSAPAAPNTA